MRMTRNEAGTRLSSLTSASADTARSTGTVKHAQARSNSARELPLSVSSSAATTAGPPPNDSSDAADAIATSYLDLDPATPTSSSPKTARWAPMRFNTTDGHAGPGSNKPPLKERDRDRDRDRDQDDPQISPTSIPPPPPPAAAPAGNPRGLYPSPAITPNVMSLRDRRLSDLSELANYRRDLAVLDTSAGGPRIPQIQHNPPTAASQIAPWMSSSLASGAAGNSSAATTPSGLQTTFYNDSSDNLSNVSQLSPAYRVGGTGSAPAISAHPPTAGAGAVANPDSPDNMSFNDERRPSLASIATASSQGSKNSSATRGGFRKLQGFFGEEFPGRDSSDTSLPGKDQPQQPQQQNASSSSRSRSYSHTHTRDRNLSNATDHTRDASPASSKSRPRTPVPGPDVVPFLYQDASDIARFGEAPVRGNLAGPDRDRYAAEPPPVPPKTSSSSRSTYTTALTGHSHRYNKSNDDARSLRPTVSREDTGMSSSRGERERERERERDRGGGGGGGSGPGSGSGPLSFRARAQSPTPSMHSLAHSSMDGPSSPPTTKRSIFNRLRRWGDREDGSGHRHRDGPTSRLPSAKTSRTDLSRLEQSPSVGDADERASPAADPVPVRPPIARGGTFNNRFPFSRRARTQKTWDQHEDQIGPTEQRKDPGTVYHLDLDLNDMDGIVLKGEPPLSPIDPGFITSIDAEITAEPSVAVAEMAAADEAAAAAAGAGPAAGTAGPGVGAWNAPDSWAVRRNTEDDVYMGRHNTDEAAAAAGASGTSLAKPEEKVTQYGIRIFRSDGSFNTLQLPLKATVADTISQLIKKTYVMDNFENFQIIMKRHNLIRILSPFDRPLMIQKRLLHQIGYEDQDRIEEIGREDNGYLCRFMFLSHRESDFHSTTHEAAGVSRGQRVNHVDLSGRNLVTIPISLYSRASEIVSLNLSRNLSLDVPRDFMQSCQFLREVKFNYNEARRLPPGLGWAGRLTILDAANNLLEQLDPDDMPPQPDAGLIKLNLANNRLGQLPSCFGAYGSLRTLNVSSNLLEEFPAFLCNLQSLVDLDLSFNGITSLPDEIGQLRNLERLAMTNNELTDSLPAGFRGLVALRELDVKHNRLHGIDVISDLPRLEIVTADSNEIAKFEGGFHRLQRLKLSKNPISRFAVTRSSPSLKSLNLSDAQLASLADESWANMPNLERLVLDKNYFASLPAQVGILSRLELLSARNNALGELPAQIGCLGELRILNVRNNNIRKLPAEIWWSGKLETLNASSNLIDQFPKPASRPPAPVGGAGPGSGAGAEAVMTSSGSSTPGGTASAMAMRMNSSTPPPATATTSATTTANNTNIINNINNINNNNKNNNNNNNNNGHTKPTTTTATPTPIGAPIPTSTPLEDVDEEDGSSRRPSGHSANTLLSVGPSPVPGSDRKPSVVSVYGKGRKTSVVSRSTSSGTIVTPSSTSSRKDSGLPSRLNQTFAGSLRHLYLADNRLEDDVFEVLTLMTELRILNLSCNAISEMPQRSIRSWPQLTELYLSLNELTTLPADDLEDQSLLQVLHINGNRFINLPAEISRAKKLAVLDCGGNNLKYNITNIPYDWNWNLNRNLRYLNLSGNKRLEIKQGHQQVQQQQQQQGLGPIGGGWSSSGGAVAAAAAAAANAAAAAASAGRGLDGDDPQQLSDFSRLQNLRLLGLMDVTLTQPRIPDQSEDRRVRTSGSLAGHFPYGMADTLGRNEHLSTMDLVVPKFQSSETELLLGLFDGQAQSSGGSKIAKFLHENFSHILGTELRLNKARRNETPRDALRRAFLALNKELVTSAGQQQQQDRLATGATATTARGAALPALPLPLPAQQPSVVLTREDLKAGGVATVAYVQDTDLYVANVGDAHAMLIRTNGTHAMLTAKHDPAEVSERARIRDAGGWISRSGRLNDNLEVSRAFGYVDLMPAVQAKPHVSHHEIREHDDVVLIATRELWEHLGHGLVADIARAERGDLMRAAQKLRDLAIAYGATGKITVMMISIANVRRRVDRSRLTRGQSMSIYPSGISTDGQTLSSGASGSTVAASAAAAKRGRRPKEDDVADSNLQRIGPEAPAPTGWVAIVFTDIKSSTTLWETYPAMRTAIRMHNQMMRRHYRRIGGYEVKTEGDAFMVSFPTATSALVWCFAVQVALLEVDWPGEMLKSVSCQEIRDKDDAVIFRGLSVRMGIHWGECVSEMDPVTKRMDYFGPMVNKASRISAVADGGQITVSSDFLTEISRCLIEYSDFERNSTAGNLDEAFEDEDMVKMIHRDLRLLSSQGFEVKEMGERKLKGLENPEFVFALYPHSLWGRIEYHQQQERAVVAASAAAAAAAATAASGPATAVALSAPTGGTDRPAWLTSPGSQLSFDPEMIWTMWGVSLRLEMLCSSLEDVTGASLESPDTELLDRLRHRGGEMTERFLINFMTHQVSRIETCVSTLSMRHLAMGGGKIRKLNDLRAPMSTVLLSVAAKLQELDQYRARFGPL